MSRVAIYGTGQLARMLALAGWHQNIKFAFLCEKGDETVCVEGLGDIIYIKPQASAEALYHELGKPDVVTVEKEFVDCDLLTALSKYVNVYPAPEFLQVTKNRALEKQFLDVNGIKTTPFRVANSQAELEQAFKQLSLPVIIKSSEQGYDGQNQWHVNTPADIKTLPPEIFQCGSLVVEKKLSFDMEVSAIAARSSNGETACYPVTENIHQAGILIRSTAPSLRITSNIQKQAKEIIETLLSITNYVGILSVEFFVCGDELIVNEMAPRVHNSGHWTMDGSITSQFENHLRAILGFKLGSTDLTQPTVMINILGQRPPHTLPERFNAKVYDYNKAEKPKRKIGHINLTRENTTTLNADVESLLKLLKQP